jgi:TRAP-type C4-dicarboxylate transport system substrate-binding protein
MGRVLKTSVLIMVFIGWVLTGFTSSAQASEPIVLKAVAFLPLNVSDVKGLFMFADILKKNSKGALEIKIIGGPEAIRPFEQFEATRKGVVDLMIAPESYYAAAVTKVPFGHLSRITPQEERKRGLYELRRELLKKHNIYYLGKGQMGGNFYFWIKSPIKDPREMAGKKIRVSPFYIPFMKALGASPVVLPPTEVYTALERGVVDGLGWPVSGVADNRWDEVCKYVIPYGVWQASIDLLMNLDTYNKIPPDLQKVLNDSMIQAELEIADYWSKEFDHEWKRVLDAGVTRLKFSPEDVRYYTELAYSSSWEDVMKNIEPKDLGPKLKKLLAE